MLNIQINSVQDILIIQEHESKIGYVNESLFVQNYLRHIMIQPTTARKIMCIGIRKGVH